MESKEAIVEALNSSFPTIFTSGSILASAGVLISKMTTNPVIAALGECLGRGTIVSIILVFFVLPQILVLGDKIIEKTSFKIEAPIGKNIQSTSGTMALNGRVRGKINGRMAACEDLRTLCGDKSLEDRFFEIYEAVSGEDENHDK